MAEANILSDPHAADAVYTAPWPVAIVGLDITHRVLMDHAFFERLRTEGGAEGSFIWEASRHYVGFYGRAVGVEGCCVDDSSAVAFAIAPELFTTRLVPVRVVERGIAIGQTIQRAAGRRYSQGEAWEGVPEQRVCTAVQADAVLELFRIAMGQSLAR